MKQCSKCKETSTYDNFLKIKHQVMDIEVVVKCVIKYDKIKTNIK